mmetsp:Transcript_6316/g.7965  ORF Transcript_6316/g.7965 Transcript_6316/m.7965 type:complete len:145 (-) Transcript_6316:664-1098(-)
MLAAAVRIGTGGSSAYAKRVGNTSTPALLFPLKLCSQSRSRLLFQFQVPIGVQLSGFCKWRSYYCSHRLSIRKDESAYVDQGTGTSTSMALNIANPVAILNAIASNYESTTRILMEYVDNALDSGEEIIRQSTEAKAALVNGTI